VIRQSSFNSAVKIPKRTVSIKKLKLYEQSCTIMHDGFMYM